jgi:hypothetical protein
MRTVSADIDVENWETGAWRGVIDRDDNATGR